MDSSRDSQGVYIMQTRASRRRKRTNSITQEEGEKLVKSAHRRIQSQMDIKINDRNSFDAMMVLCMLGRNGDIVE